MRLAMMERMRVMGTSSPGCGAAVGAVAVVGLAAAGADDVGAEVEAAAADAFAPPLFMYPRMSVFVMRPAEPEPAMPAAASSMLFSFAILRTSGEERGASPVDVV